MLGRVLAASNLADDLRRDDAAFAERVQQHESAHGALTGDALAVAAEANYLCWFEADFPRSLLRVCAAINGGLPARLNLCQQVSPERWLALHHYVVAARRRLDDTRPVPPSLDTARVDYLAHLLGADTPARRALTEVFLAVLLDHLLYATSLSALGPRGAAAADYEDFSAWYRRAGVAAGPVGHGVPDGLAAAARATLAAETDSGEELLAQLLRSSGGRCQPPCMHRYERYQEVRLASIGALQWRGNLPPDPRPRSYWSSVFDDASAALQTWFDGRPPQTALAADVHAALGSRNPAKEGLVTIFLNQPPSSARFFDWMRQAAVSSGSMAWQLCGLPGPDAGAL
ncbi:MAG: hypothetical protein ACYC5O_13650 [Anaerolineae bacterium]